MCIWRMPTAALNRRSFGQASPGRVLGEAFIRYQLPEILAPGEIDVLEIGCGSGRMTRLLAEAGYRGSYTGIDIDNRFDTSARAGHGFKTHFIQRDALTADITHRLDLIVSMSVLEHIPNDARLIERLDGLLKPYGMQLHILPSTWGLFPYLWHGFRQYGAGAIAERFDNRRAVAYKLGGVFSFTTHWLCITVPELLLRKSFRRRLLGLYLRLVYASLRLDRLVPLMPSAYAVVQPVRQASR